MNISIYKCIDEKIKLTKTLTDEIIYVGDLRESSDVLNPTITIQSDNIITGNYMYIEDFNRYYFITDIECIQKNVWKITAHIDVLMTYKDDIKKLNVIVGRQENAFNVFLSDSEVKVQQNRQVSTIKFPIDVFNLQGESFVLTVAGGGE